MSKVTVVGAGAVGATCANVMACREVASEVVLIDIKEGLSEGKMLDMYQCSTLMDFDTKLVGATNDYKKTASLATSRQAITFAQVAPTAPAPTTVTLDITFVFIGMLYVFVPYPAIRTPCRRLWRRLQV